MGTYGSLCTPRSFPGVNGGALETPLTSLIVSKVRVLSPSLSHPVLETIAKSPGKLGTRCLIGSSVTPIQIADSTLGSSALLQGTSWSGVRLLAVILLLPRWSFPRYISLPAPNSRDAEGVDVKEQKREARGGTTRG